MASVLLRWRAPAVSDTSAIGGDALPVLSLPTNKSMIFRPFDLQIDGFQTLRFTLTATLFGGGGFEGYSMSDLEAICTFLWVFIPKS